MDIREGDRARPAGERRGRRSREELNGAGEGRRAIGLRQAVVGSRRLSPVRSPSLSCVATSRPSHNHMRRPERWKTMVVTFGGQVEERRTVHVDGRRRGRKPRIGFILERFDCHVRVALSVELRRTRAACSPLRVLTLRFTGDFS